MDSSNDKCEECSDKSEQIAAMYEEIAALERKLLQKNGCHHSWIDAEARQRKRAERAEGRILELVCELTAAKLPGLSEAAEPEE